MARDLTAGVVTEITGELVQPILLVHLEFDSGDLSLWTGIGDLVWNGITFTGAGDFGSISEISETEGIKANGLELTLSGIPSSIIAIALTQEYQDRPATLWCAFLDTANNIVSDPYQQFKGKMDVMAWEDNGETANISLSVESVLIDLERPKERRYTDEDQQSEYSGDRGFEFVAGLQEKEIVLE